MDDGSHIEHPIDSAKCFVEDILARKAGGTASFHGCIFPEGQNLLVRCRSGKALISIRWDEIGIHLITSVVGVVVAKTICGMHKVAEWVLKVVQYIYPPALIHRWRLARAPIRLKVG